MRGLPVCTSAGDVARALDFVDPARVERARVEADARPIAYALGSGEADEVALYAGIKPLVRQVLPAGDVAHARARFVALGLVASEAEHRVALPSTLGTVLFVGRDAARVAEAVRCEAAPDHDRELGRLLGYPRCCVEAYLEVPPPRRNVDVLARTRAASQRFAPRLNVLDLAVFHYVSWLPCSFSCELSASFADAVARHIADRHGQFLGRGRSPCPPGCRHQRFVAEIDAALAADRLLVTEDVQVSMRGGRAWPTARDRDPNAVLSNDAREAVARLVAAIDERGAPSLLDGVLHLGGEAVLRAPDALFVPFGG